MVHVTSGYIDEVTRLTSYVYRKASGYKPVTPHGTRHSVNGRNTTFSKTSKAPKTKTAPAIVAETHATAYTMASVNYDNIKAVYKEKQKVEVTPIKSVKIVKHGRSKKN